MALPNPLEAFTWGAGGARLTPEELAKRRQVEDALLARGVDTSPVGHWTQGLARVADAMAGSIRRGETDDASSQNASESQSLIAKLLSGAGGEAFPAAPGGGGQFPAAPVAGGGDYASQRVAQAHAVDLSGDKQAFVDALMPAALEASKRTGVDPRIIVAQAAQETGWGKSAPGNNYFGIKSHGKEGGQTFATHEVVNGQRVKINDSFRQFGSPGDSVAGYADFLLENPRYKPMMAAQGLDAQLQALGASGYATDPNYASSVGSIARGLPMPAAAANEAMATAMATGQPIDPVQVASLDPSAGLSEAVPQTGAAAPTSNGGPAAVSPQAQRVLSTMMDPQPIGGPLQAPGAPQQQVAQALMGSDTAALDQIPVMAGGNSGVGQPAQAAPQGINPAIIEALSSPYADAQTRQIAGILLQQHMQANDPGAKLDMEYKRAQIDALQNKGEKLPDSVRALNIRAQQAGLQPGTPEYNQFMVSGGSGPMVTVNNGSNTSEFVKKSDEAAAKRMDEVVAAGQTAPQTLADMQQLLDLGATIGTGKEAQVKAFLGPYAQSLGINIEGLGEIQAYEAITSRLAPQMRAVGSGSSSDRDVSMFLQSLPNLRNTPQGNEIIGNTMKAVAQNKMNAAEIASKAQRGEISWQDADKQIRELPNPYDLFKGFQKQGEAQPGAVPQGVDPADWEFLTPEERRLFQ